MLLLGGILTDHVSVLNTEVILNEDMSGNIHIFSDCLIDVRVFSNSES
jgi:hypothetical protein